MALQKSPNWDEQKVSIYNKMFTVFLNIRIYIYINMSI